MNEKEKHVRENAPHAHDNADNADQIANSMTAKGKNEKRQGTAQSNRLWMWLGVIILIFILLYWLFSIGIFEDVIGYFNG